MPFLALLLLSVSSSDNQSVFFFFFTGFIQFGLYAGDCTYADSGDERKLYLPLEYEMSLLFSGNSVGEEERVNQSKHYQYGYRFGCSFK